MAKKSDTDLLLKLRRSDLSTLAFNAGLFLEYQISGEVLEAAWKKKCIGKSTATTEALFNGYWELHQRANEFAARARDHGQLLFAHAGSTVLLQGGAA